jgi:hypothetical protein
MAHKTQAVSKLAPQVVSAGAVHDDEFIKDITDDAGMSEGRRFKRSAPSCGGWAGIWPEAAPFTWTIWEPTPWTLT